MAQTVGLVYIFFPGIARGLVLQTLKCRTSDAHHLFHGGLLPHIVVCEDDVLGVVGCKVDDVEGRIVPVAVSAIMVGVLKVSDRRLEEEVTSHGILLRLKHLLLEVLLFFP